ncbi:MAG: hypothetical protein QOG27_503 [Verrucomicrobiota bacterium]
MAREISIISPRCGFGGCASHLSSSLLIIIRIGMCVRRAGVAVAGSIALSNFRRSKKSASGAAGILNAGGRETFSVIGGRNEMASWKCTHGQKDALPGTTTARVRFWIRTGGRSSPSSPRPWASQMCTSRSILIACGLRTRSPIGKADDLPSTMLRGHSSNCARKQRSWPATSAAHFRRRNMRGRNSGSRRRSITQTCRHPIRKRRAK